MLDKSATALPPIDVIIFNKNKKEKNKTKLFLMIKTEITQRKEDKISSISTKHKTKQKKS